MTLPRALPVLLLFAALGGLTLPAQQPAKPISPPAAADDEPLLFNNAPVMLQMNGLRGWACTVSPDGKTLVTCAGGGEQAGEIHVWDLAEGKVRRTINHTKGIRSLAISADGRTLATGSYDSSLRLYDLKTGELKAVGAGHAAGVNGVVFTSDGKRLVTAGLDKIVRVWQTPVLPAAGAKPAEFKPYTSLEEHSNRVFSVAVSKDGKTILSGGEDRTARVWDMPEPAADGKPVVVKKSRRVLTGHGNAVESVAITPDGRTALTGSWDATVRVWEIDTGRLERSVFSGTGYGVLSVAISPDGQNYVIASGNSGSNTPGEVRHFTLDDNTGGAPLMFIQNTAMRCAAFAPDGNTVVSIDENRVVRVKALNDEGSPRELKSPNNALQSSQIILAVAWSRDGKSLAVAGENGSVTLYDTVAKQSRAWAAHDDVISALAFSPDGKTLASASHDGAVKLWSIETWRAVSTSDRSFWGFSTAVAAAPAAPPVRVLAGHTNWVFCVAFSHDGKRLVSGGYDKTVRIWDAVGSGAPVVIKGREAHSAGVRAVMFLPSDDIVVSTGADRTIRFWDAKSGKDRGLVRGHKGVIRALALAPDGKTLASGSEDQTVKIWELKRGGDGNFTATEKRELTGHGDMVASLAFSPKGRTLAVGTWNGGIHLWDPTTGRQRTVMRTGQQAVSAVAFAPDGQSLAAGGYDRAARIWPASSPPASAALVSYLPHDQAVTAAALSADGQWTATGDQNGTVRIFERNGKLKLSASAHAGGVTAIAALPSGSTFVSVGRDRKLQFWDPQATGPGNPVRQMMLSVDTPLCIACAPKSPLVAVSGEGKTIQIIDAQLLVPVKQLTGHTGSVRALSFSPNGALLASAGADRTFRLWDTKTWAVTKQSPTGPNNGEFYALAFSPDGGTLALAHNQEQVITPDGQLEQQQFRQVMLVDVGTGQPKSNMQQAFFHNDYVTGVAFSPDGAVLITASRDMNIRFWSMTNNQIIRQIQAHRAGINMLAIDPGSGHLLTVGDDRLAALWNARFRQDSPRTTLAASAGQVWFAEPSPDGTMLATGGDDKIVRLRKGTPGTQPFSFAQPSRACFSLAASADGKLIASGHADGTIAVWDATSGKRVKELKGHQEIVWSLVFLDGNRLVAGSGSWNKRAEQPGEAKLWDVEKGTVIRDFAGHASTVYVAMPSPDGKTLATGTHDGSLRIWELETGKLKHTMTVGTPVRTLAFLPDNATLISAGHEDPNFIFWDVAAGKQKARYTLPDETGHVNRLRVSPDGKTLALVTNGPGQQRPNFAAPPGVDFPVAMAVQTTNEQMGTLLLWDLATNKVRAKSATGNRMLDGEFTPDGGMFVTVGGVYAQFGEIKVWGTGQARFLGELHGHKRWLEAATFTKDGRLISGGGINQPIQRGGGTQAIPIGPTEPRSQQMEPGELRIWDLAGMYPQHELKGHSNHVTCAAFAPNSQLLATGGGDKTVVIWDLAPTRKGLLPDKRTLNHEEQLRCVRFTPDGKLLAASDEKGQVRLWDPFTGQLVRMIEAHTLPVYGVTFSKDGQTLVTCAGNWRNNSHGEVKLWDVASGKQKGELPRQAQAVWCVAFSPNNELLATAGQDGMVCLYEMTNKTVSRTLRLGVPVRHLAFSPDGTLLAAGPNADNDTAIRLWEVASGQERATLQGHTAMTFTVRFSGDGKTLVSCSKDGTTKLWDIPPGKPALTAKK